MTDSRERNPRQPTQETRSPAEHLHDMRTRAFKKHLEQESADTIIQDSLGTLHQHTANPHTPIDMDKVGDVLHSQHAPCDRAITELAQEKGAHLSDAMRGKLDTVHAQIRKDAKEVMDLNGKQTLGHKEFMEVGLDAPTHQPFKGFKTHNDIVIPPGAYAKNGRAVLTREEFNSLYEKEIDESLA